MKIRPAILLFTLGAAVALNAAPKLRLTQTAVGPIVIAQGSNGPSIPLPPYVYNGGDGALNLSATSSDTWLVPTLGAPTGCQNGPACIPVRLGLQTATLAKGAYTGFVTVADPNALDAPQTISVTVDIGGAVPDQLTFYTPPGGSASATFFAATNTIARSSTQSGGAWLSVAAGSLGSFQFSTPYGVVVNAGTLAAGDYNGNIGVSNSPVLADNKSISVTMHVTTQPIAQPTSTSVQFTIAQGAAKQISYVILGNSGQGTLTVSGATAATASGGNWLTAQAGANNLITLTADPTGVSPGTYQGTLTVTSNAVNGNTTIPVTLTVQASGPPFVIYKGVVNVFTNLSDDGLAQGTVAAVYGNQFTTADPQVSNLPLGTTFAGTQVLINGKPIPVQYVAAGQINIQIPYDAPVGDATLTVVRGSQQGNTVSINIVPVAPVVLPYPGGTYALAQTGSGGFEGYSPAVPAQAGDVLVLYAVGLGATTPSVVAGTAAPLSPLATVPGVKLCFGDPNPIDPFRNCVDPQFVGLTPTFFGLYQINFAVPALKGDAVPIFVQMGNVRSNILSFAIK